MFKKLLLKNMVINTVLVYIFSKVPGWSVQGIYKLLTCTALIALLTILLLTIDLEIIKGEKYGK